MPFPIPAPRTLPIGPVVTEHKSPAVSVASTPCNEALAWGTKAMGLTTFHHNLLKAQAFVPGKNDMCNPSTVYECLVAAQAISGKAITGDLRNYMSEDPAHSKACLDAHSKMIAAMGHSDLRLGEGMMVVLKKATAKEIFREVSALPDTHAIACDFSNPKERGHAIAKVNDWIDKQSHGFIKACPGTDNWRAATRFAIASVVYMLAKWEQPFNPLYTHKADFHNANQTKKVDMMRIDGTAGQLSLNPGDGYEFLFARRFIAAEGCPLTMLYALPEKGIGDDAHTAYRGALLDRLHKDGLQGLGLEEKIVDEFCVPKFDLEQTRDISVPGAEGFLSDPGGEVDVKQTMRFNHSEEGVEAAAVTGMCVADSIPIRPRVCLTLDRPFEAFVVLDGRVLFTLHINDPQPAAEGAEASIAATETKSRWGNPHSAAWR